MRKMLRLQIAVLLVVVFGVCSMGSTAYADPARRVLLLPDAYTDGTDALVKALESAGHNVTYSEGLEFEWDGTNPSLEGFDAVIHLNGATHDSSPPLEAQTALVEFVKNGGNYIGGQFNGYEQAFGYLENMKDLVLQLWPHPDNCNGCNMTWTAVPGNEKHPVLEGVPNSFTFLAEGHDAGPVAEFTENPSVILMTSPAGGAAVTVRELGDGRVVNFSFAPNFTPHNDIDSVTGETLHDDNIQQLYINAVSWGGYTIEESIDILIDEVRKLVEDGSLEPIQGFFLILRLRIAQRQLDYGRPGVAVFLLENFTYQVEDLIAVGDLDASEGQPLIDAALEIIEDINQ